MNAGDLAFISGSIVSAKAFQVLDDNLLEQVAWIGKDTAVVVLSSEVMQFQDNVYVMVASSTGVVGWVRNTFLVPAQR